MAGGTQEKRIVPLHEDSARQIWIGWGAAVMCLGLAYLIGGYFWPYFCIFAGGIMALRGHCPGWFTTQIEAQIIAGKPAQRKESIRSWIGAGAMALVLAGVTSIVHRKVAPEKPDLAKTIVETIKGLLDHQKVAPAPTPSPTPPPPQPSQAASAVYPWLRWNRVNDPGGDWGIQLMLFPNGYPELKVFQVKPWMTKINVRLGVPVAINPKQAGWWSCLIAEFEESEWNVNDAVMKPVAAVAAMQRPTILIEGLVADRNTSWSLKVVITKKGDDLEYSELVGGRINKNGIMTPLVVRENSQTRRRSYDKEGKTTGAQFSMTELKAGGVPVRDLMGTDLERMCERHRYMYQVGFANANSVDIEHNFGK